VAGKKPIGDADGLEVASLVEGKPGQRGTGRLGAYWMTISTRWFRDSRTPSSVYTKRPCSPRTTTLIACAGSQSPAALGLG
jgi:hypothetical protein